MYGLAQAFSDHRRDLAAGVRQQHQKFFATIPPDEILPAQRAPQALGNSHQHGIARQLLTHTVALGFDASLSLTDQRSLYRAINDELAEDYTRPLQLLAKELKFSDPLSGERHHFISRLPLNW